MNIKKLIVVGPNGHLGCGRLRINPNIDRVFSSYSISACDCAERLLSSNQKSGLVPSTWSTIPYKSLYDHVDRNTVVALLSPSNTHYKMADRMASAGAKVYVEKPLCVTQNELKALDKKYRNVPILPLYAADHYYFGNIAGLRLMGINMPFTDRVHITLDKSPDKKFSECISKAIPYFNSDEIKEIKHVMHEQEVYDLVNRPWYYKKNAGGGTLMDLHFHLFNLMNLMGLKVNKVSKSFALRHEHYSDDFNALLKAKKSIAKFKGPFKKFENGVAEDAIYVEGKVNKDIPISMESVRFVGDNKKELLIIGKNGQKIKFLPSSSAQKVQLLDENDRIIAEAQTTHFAYDTMLEDIRLKLFEGRDSGFLRKLFDTQMTTIQQILNIKSTLSI